MASTNAARYFQDRAACYRRLAGETTNQTLREAYEAIAADMLQKAAATKPDDEVYLVGDLALDSPLIKHRPPPCRDDRQDILPAPEK